MHKPITNLFSSQPTKDERVVQEEKSSDEGIMVSFADFQFNPDEDNVPDNMIMSGKQFKNLNNKINSPFQIQADNGGRNFNTEVEMEHLLKSQENRFRSLVESLEQKLVERKVDVITDAITKLVDFNTYYSTKLEVESEKDSQTNIKSELTPILELVLQLPTNAPPARQVSQGGDKGCGGVGSSKDSEKGVVVGKVISIQMSTSLPISLTTTSTTRPLRKWIIINEGVKG
ncbi:unnamed protein product [Lactuca saligna]|uniref:Uncharacterized protein n=1 Tax=Lactuca saligna TaxID=75948 RepID=A0AA36ED75_LACSI|nr:unnamed protein product [Lactuca saligna]